MAAKKTNRKKKTARAKGKPVGRKKVTTRKKRGASVAGRASNPGPRARIHQGVGLKKAGRSPDTQGLSSVEDVDSESVTELVDEGQSFEAEVLDGVERAGAANQGEVTTEEVPEDDVPSEYRDDRETDV